MAEERCSCCDLPVYSCGKSVEMKERYEEKLRRAELLGWGWTPAKYDGKCAGCGSSFSVGTLISSIPGRKLQWIAECCSEVD